MSDREDGEAGVEWRRPWGLYAVAGLIVVLVVAGSVVKLTDRSGPESSPTPSPSTAVTAGPTGAATPSMGTVRRLPKSATKVLRSAKKGPLVPHAPDGFTVVGLATSEFGGHGRLVRIHLASGRVTARSIPGLASSGPLSFLAGTGGVFLRPLDAVPGYLFDHRGHDWQLTGGTLGSGGIALPGPTPNTLWMQAQNDPNLFRLLRIDGVPTGGSIRTHAGTVNDNVLPDGAGYLMRQSMQGAWDLRPTQQRRITHGTVVAVGRRTVLVRPGRPGPGSTLTVINRSNGQRHTVPAACSGPPVQAPSGTVSPDGRTAAVLCSDRGDRRALHLVDLRTGDESAVATVTQSGALNLLWSPDSRSLLALDHTGHLVAIDRRTRHVTTMHGLPALTRIAPVRGTS